MGTVALHRARFAKRHELGELLGTLVLLSIPESRWKTADIHEPLA
jgi:hypothetical protein